MVPARVRRKMRAAWTPERRKAQAERMRKIASKRQRAGSTEPIRALNRSSEALVYLHKAARYLTEGYKEGREVGEADPYVFLALRTLTKRG